MFHSPHLIVACFSLLPVALSVFQCFQFINLYHCFSFLPSLLSSPCQCVLVSSVPFSFLSFCWFVFALSPCLHFPLCSLPSSFPFFSIHSLPLVMPFFPPLKNTKSRGSKHKSRRKSKKQKRPSTVCNSLT